MVKKNFFEYLDFALQFAPAGPEEKRFAGSWPASASAGKKFDFKDLSLEHKAEVALAGMEDGKIEKEMPAATR